MTYYGVFSQFNQDEEDKKKASQVASEQQKTKRYYGQFEKFNQEVKQPTTPEVPPLVAATPVKQPSLWDKLISGVKKVVTTAIPQLSKEKTIVKTGFEMNKTIVKAENPYYKFPDFFPNPDFLKPQVSGASAKLSPAGQKFYENPIDNSILATRDFLTYHPKVLETLASMQQFVETGLPDDKFSTKIAEGILPPLALFGITKEDPIHRSILVVTKGIAETIFGSSNMVKETFDQRLYNPPKTWVDKGIDKVGTAVGSMLPYVVGTMVTGGAGIPLKIGLPLVSATVGQLSADSQTRIDQRLMQMPIDMVTGFIQAFIPGTKFVEGKFLKSTGKVLLRANLTGLNFAGGTFLTSLIKGLPKEEAAKVASSAYLTGMLFYTAASSMGYLVDEFLGTKVKTGKAVYSPDDLEAKIYQTGLDKTTNGKQLLTVTNEARAQGENVQVDLEAFRQGILYTKLGINTIPITETTTIKEPGKITEQKMETKVSGGIKIEGKLTKSPPKLPGEVKPEAPITPPAKLPEVIKQELEVIPQAGKAKDYASAADFAQAVYGARPSNQIGVVDPNIITIRDKVGSGAEHDKLKADIQANGFQEPIRITQEGDEFITTEGSQRTSIAQELGIKIPVIVNKGIMEGLKTIRDIYNENHEVSPPLPEKPVVPTEVKPEEKPTGEGIGKTTFSLSPEQQKAIDSGEPIPDLSDVEGSQYKPSPRPIVIGEEDLSKFKKGQTVSYNGKEYELIDAIKGRQLLYKTEFKLKDLETGKTKTISGFHKESEIDVIKEPTQAKGEIEPTTKIPPTKQSEDFFIHTGEGFVKTEGKPVEIIKGVDTFIHKEDKRWIISEGKSGMKIADGNTRASTIDLATKLINENKDKMEELIKSATSRHGISPRYQKPAIIKEYEPTNKGAGGKPRPGQPADIVPKGKVEQAGTGEAVEVPSGEMARGIGEVGNLGARERPTARINDRVSFIRNEELLTGSIRSIDGEQATIDVDQISTAGEVPIGRLVNVKLTDLTVIEKATAEKKSATWIEENVPINVAEEARADWVDNYLEIYVNEKDSKLKDKLESAFINKWKRKSAEKGIPAVASKTQQVDINRQVEELVAKKGTGDYTNDEKALLRQYTGSGGLEKAGAEGRGLLDEYYTPKPIVDFMWSKVKELESTFNNILEPAAGIGNFIEPTTKQQGLITAQEINKTAATIIEVLYPSTEVFTKPFESNFIGLRGEKIKSKGLFDLVIGNPPYGEHRGKYLGLGEEPKIVKYEDYFMKRGLDILKDEGLLAYVIPSTFLRSGVDYAKEEIGKLGQLEVAYRLPQGVFGTTTIGTDIVIFRKGGLTDPEFLSNDKYFLSQPKNVLGKVSKGTGRYGQDEVVGTLESAIKQASEKPAEIADTIPEDQVVENEKEMVTEIKPDFEIVKTPLDKWKFSGNVPEELSTRGARLGDKRVSNRFDTKEEAEKALAEFNKKRMPPVNRVPEASVITNALNKKAIIIPGKKDGRLKLNDVSVEDNNMWVSVNVTGELKGDYAARFNPKTFVNNKIAIDGDTGQYYPNILYYQGNIYEKLDDLELFRSKINPEQYEIQKKGLMAVLPPVQPINNIQLQPPSDFVTTMRVPVEGGGDDSLIQLFRDFMHSLPWESFGSSSSWEIEGYINGSIVNTGDKVENIEVRKRRRMVGNSLFKRFVQEVLTPEQQKYIEDKYNRNFNAYYRPDYRQVPILSEVNASFNPKHKPGKHPLVIKEIQKEGAAFLATKGVGLLGYDVGVGKTLTAIVAINDVMKKGWAKRPLLIVPNGVYRNWINEISEVIPDVKINSMMNLGAAFKGDLKTLQVEEGTLSIITYDGLVKLGFKPETYDGLTANLKDVMMGMNNTKRAAAKEEAGIEAQIGRAIKGTTGDRFFEDLGFDHITIDEVQNFKNIFAGAKMQRGQGNEYRNIRGSSSARGIKAYLMAQYVLKNNNNRNVFLLSATPFTNSPMEIYSILSLMGKKRLENLGLKNVNDFMSMFMELKPTFVVKANQTVREEDVVERFQNLQQLQKLVTEFIDFRTGEEAGIDRPGRIKRTITLSPTELQNDYVSKAQALFQDKDKGGAIVAITELQNITLSPYLSRYNEHSPTYREFVDNSPKIKFAIEAVAQVYKDNHNVGQIIYMPRGVDKFPLLREYLIKEKKFKPGQVAEITGGMTIDAKQRIQNDFNAGTIKVLIGTEAIKEGVNLQEKTTDMYHLHLPWNPTDMLQVEGRIWRQGND